MNHFIYNMERAGKETGRNVLVAMVVASLASLSGSSLPGMSEWPH